MNINNRLKLILLAVGIAFLAFGLYTLFTPETSLHISMLDVTSQSKINSYIIIGLGLASIVISFIRNKPIIKPTLKN